MSNVLAGVGALNWGLVAFMKFNLVEYLDTLTGAKGLDVIVYGLVAVAGVYVLLATVYGIFKCGKGSCSCT